jgi:hypothetical protein
MDSATPDKYEKAPRIQVLKSSPKADHTFIFFETSKALCSAVSSFRKAKPVSKTR